MCFLSFTNLRYLTFYLRVRYGFWSFKLRTTIFTQKIIVLKWKSHILQNFGPDLKQNVFLSDLSKLNYKTSAQIPLFF